MTLAIFDLDNTLLGGDSDHRWGEFLVQKGLVDAEEYRRQNDLFYQDYQNAVLDMQTYLDFSLAPLARHTMEELTALHQEFMAEHIEPLMLPKAEALLQQHREQGHTLLIITATNSFVTLPIAKRLGIEHILASDAEIIDGRYTGKCMGTPCFQDGKVTRLREWMKEQQISLAGSYFYSDSINDLPLLEEVDHPVAVDPDPRLHAVATERGWRIISLRG